MLGRCQSGGPPVRAAGRRLQRRHGISADAGAQEKRSRFALLIDGDVYGPTKWGPAQDAVSARGDLASSFVFAAPGRCDNRKWAGAMSSLRIQPVPVPRRSAGSGDPNDIAIGMEATRLLSQGDVDAIALLAGDADFVYLAERVRGWGKHFLAILLDGGKLGIGKAFAEANVEIAWIRDAAGARANSGTMKAVLSPDGRGSIQLLSPEEDQGLSQGRGFELLPLTRTLQELEFLHNSDDPLVPGLAKFFHANSLGHLSVYPKQLAYGEAVAALESGSEGEWQGNPGDLVFVLPQRNGQRGKSALAKYGSDRCAHFALAGGPFLLRSSSMLVDEVLSRLGYLDDQANADFGEAVDVFASQTHNARNLRLIGIDIPACLDMHSKRALLHSALVSSKLHGVWGTSPRDGILREMLVKHGSLACVDAPVGDAWTALLRFSSERGLPATKTYNGLVAQVNRHLSAGDALRRR